MSTLGLHLASPNPALPAGLFAAPTGYVSVALASGSGQTADLPGPAAGHLRLYDGAWAVANALTSTLSGLTLDLIGSGTYRVFAGGSGANTQFPAGLPPIGHGEVWRVTNGGNNAGRVLGTYIDVPVGNITLVRMNLTAVAQTIIPAPPAGKFSRWLQAFLMPSSSKTVAPAVRTLNVDSITHSIEQLIGGQVCGRSGAISSGAQGVWPIPISICVHAGTGALSARTTEALGAGSGPTVVAAYETLVGIAP